MKNKYYLNEKIVKTSERNYTYAITYKGRLIACCGSCDLAMKRYNTELNYVTNENIIGYMGRGNKENSKYLKIELLKKVSA